MIVFRWMIWNPDSFLSCSSVTDYFFYFSYPWLTSLIADSPLNGSQVLIPHFYVHFPFSIKPVPISHDSQPFADYGKCAPFWSFSFPVRSWLSRCNVFIGKFLHCGFSPTILRCHRDFHCYLSDGTLHISADMLSLMYTYLYLYFILIMYSIV